MKKINLLFFAFSLLLLSEFSFSQPYMLKSEIMPDQRSRDSRFSVLATIMDNDSWCQVTWPDPGNNHLELAYDDSEADDFFIFAFPGSMNANKFSPSFHPFIVSGGRIYVGDGSFPGPFLGTSFQVLVYDDDGENGLPGTALDSMDVTVNNYGWVEFEGMTVSITDGDFYLVMKQTAPSPNTAPVGVDSDNPTYYISYTKYNDNEWVPAPVQDFMIRAWIIGYEGSVRNIDYFELDRFSGFDPDISPLLGEITILDTLSVSEFNDYAWNSLPPGWYAYGVKTHFTGGEWSDYDVSNVVPHLLNFYSPSCFYQADTGNRPLITCPPQDSTGAVPPEFMGYNLYSDSSFITFLPPSTTSFNPGWPYPSNITLELTALYDLTVFGYPDEIGESFGSLTNYRVRYGYPLPFLEQWDTGTFETNNWTKEGENWSVNDQAGNPAPVAEFTWDPVQTNYEFSLTSYPLLADSLTEGKIFLDFDIKLDAAVSTGNELILVQLWNWENQVWNTVKTFSNLDGSFDWISEHINIKPTSLTQVFKIRFLARGENSINILGWFIDNIKVYRTCNPPTDLQLHPNGQLHGIELTWEKPAGAPVNEWIQWDDGVNSGNSIGTGSAVEFDVAQRWEPVQLLDYEGASVTEIAFFPSEPTATYRVRVWFGEGAQNLVADQLVGSPISGQWNYVTLISPPPIDITQELWVGYYVNTTGGYPAGVDNGPAINGYGNMMNFGGWQTLLQINPDLDYNWNIKAHLETINAQKAGSRELLKYALYRRDLWNVWFLRAYPEDEYFLDDSALCETSNFHCYKVSAIYASDSDYCESQYSNEDCEICPGVKKGINPFNISIYPNPCNDILKIESSEKLGLISLYNSFGELMLKRKVDENQLEIPVAVYPAGVYMIRVDSGGRVISKKVMVVH
jgi:hypothetical protein